ncbi:MAG: AAA family ATPase [Gammaproteobacteria bacterium]|nr:AAA family ATPase [Gammaproteobacteria bacterium]MBT4607730.1 AAA family ATPase [Thiotrichales bacterium]MBT3472908.1 AAA family ATPase [Gammaproteobacteria bacterium]MBT3966574.1 AAA family ATPase [Gammaproteobacteria bacterium]MBT4081732.1 AAA family ATPase [Gammaproteobacteria bacterium]
MSRRNASSEGLYLDHFRLNEAPFNLAPDTDYYYDSPTHHDALGTVLLAIDDGAGFIKITGEVGTGKTLLCRKLVNDLGKPFEVAYLPNPPLTPDQLYRSILREFNLELEAETSQALQLQQIQDQLLLNFPQKLYVVVVDEAQAVPDETMEALRLLTNLETEKHRLLQVVLFGQPELDYRLEQGRLRQLHQRVVFSSRISPLSLQRVEKYIDHRLNVAGHRGESLFTQTAMRLLFQGSRGEPRLLNILAHKALLLTYGKGKYRVSKGHVRAAVKDTDAAYKLPWISTGLWMLLLGAAALLLALLLL